MGYQLNNPFWRVSFPPQLHWATLVIKKIYTNKNGGWVNRQSDIAKTGCSYLRNFILTQNNTLNTFWYLMLYKLFLYVWCDENESVLSRVYTHEFRS